MTRARSGGDRGIALIAALWATAIVAVIVMSVMQLTRADARVGRGRTQTAQLTAIADGAISLVILSMLGPPQTQPPVNGIPYDLAFDGHTVRVRVLDEAGKIDLNMTSAETLRQLLIVVGLDNGAATEMANRIVDWRDPRRENRSGASDTKAYQAAGRSYDARNAPYQSVEELHLLLGMTDDLYQRIAPSLTVYSQTKWIDPSYADQPVLQAFAAIDPNALAALVRLDEERRGLSPPRPSPGVTVGHAFSIVARVETDDGGRATRGAVVRLVDDARMPVLTYRWD